MSQTDSEFQSLREKFYNATVIERIDCHENLARFRIRPDNGVPAFIAGQYVTLGLGYWEPRLSGTQVENVPEKKRHKLIRRAYSISCPLLDDDGQVASIDSLDYLEFYITLVRASSSPDQPPPALTPRLFELQAGDRVEVGKKIVGKYVVGEVDPDATILMLGTGTGEAPHNAMTASLLAAGHRGRIVNACCVRYLGDLGYYPRHLLLMNHFSNYRYLPCTTREPINIDPSMPGYVGKQYLQDLFTSGKLAEAADDPLSPENTHVYLCGNPDMIGYVPPGGDPPATPGLLPLLESAGFLPADHDHESGPGRIRFEKYW
ncbi:ferredoxin--NADP reductase [Roseiconus lacunae]|uniref:ferredoxin--NADP(+) reductase n=1 Tax=Roseiconus lacunae TaxID=2605694 RepID=A0ABT7PMY7_9BACT|nr:ferredoxin--NADP reductase [Roseiconus lacunae]MCD0462641.1 ferredoxin--NADP reductase [Roseiconus lacunae]MDM4017865.1 ferredoxin--NADP reductase [Roseiconus lacunae]WRQ52559.1 ferredoxin--NADP reductase [Stieleria sp. HD01]